MCTLSRSASPGMSRGRHALIMPVLQGGENLTPVMRKEVEAELAQLVATTPNCVYMLTSLQPAGLACDAFSSASISVPQSAMCRMRRYIDPEQYRPIMFDDYETLLKVRNHPSGHRCFITESRCSTERAYGDRAYTVPFTSHRGRSDCRLAWPRLVSKPCSRA